MEDICDSCFEETQVALYLYESESFVWCIKCAVPGSTIQDEIQCKECDDLMAPINYHDRHNSIDRECVYKPGFCEYCCACGGHS